MNGLTKATLFVGGTWLLIRAFSSKAVTPQKETTVNPVVVTQPITPGTTSTTALVIVTNNPVTSAVQEEELNIFLNLEKGSAGKEVAELQKQLGLTASGTFDQLTEDKLYSKTLTNSTSLYQFSLVKYMPLILPYGTELIVTEYSVLGEVKKNQFGKFESITAYQSILNSSKNNKRG